MKEHNLPEEKLLRLIKGAKKDPPPAPAAAVPPQPGAKKLSMPALDLKSVALVMQGAAVLALLYLLKVFFMPLHLPAEHLQQQNASETVSSFAPANPLDYYLGAGQENLFSSFVQEEAGGAQERMVTELTKDLNVVGILAGEKQQAIIEDKRSQKTFYVSKGEYVGEFMVEEILDNKVILNYNGKRSELYF